MLPKNAEIWLPGYLKSWTANRFGNHRGPGRVWFAITDHYEPLWGQSTEETARERVARWTARLPEISSSFRDSRGQPPKYTFFYPQEQYRPDILDDLAKLTQLGIADVEIHIHHDREGQQDFIDRMSGFAETLFRRHSLLRKRGGLINFGFIHGNFALDNSFPGGRWCGLNNELSLLKSLGCYADFTFPSAPSPTQPRMVNTIYWASDDPRRPKSYDTGVPLAPGGESNGGLLMIPGPLAIDWSSRGPWKPRLEIGELASYYEPSPDRIRNWLDYSPRIGSDIFIKLFTHGTQERHSRLLLGEGLQNTFQWVERECSRQGHELYYVTAWQMSSVVEALRLRKDPLSELP
jgi:hypothetical protein